MTQDEFRRLMIFVAGVGAVCTGKIRADANELLLEHGMPDFPMSGNEEELKAVQDQILNRLNSFDDDWS